LPLGVPKGPQLDATPSPLDYEKNMVDRSVVVWEGKSRRLPYVHHGGDPCQTLRCCVVRILHIEELRHLPLTMVEPTTIEHLAEALCGVSAILFTFIASFSRSPAVERQVQNLIAITLIAAAVMLWWLSLSGGELWGSNYLPKPLSLVCVIIAIAARMNIKGENVSFGANPHTIGKESAEE
tara:strand:- start:574 stop:1116 length:543 start_codon:yes stop_codon:yes gene_type:complete